jgi:hypothetical protein
MIHFTLASSSHWLIAVIVSTWLGNHYVMIVILGWLLGGFWAVSSGLAIHEAAHHLVLKGRWPACLAGLVAEMP